MIYVQVLSFHGELDVARKAHIERELDRINFCGPEPSVILDLADVPYLDTTFFRALSNTRRQNIPGARICIVANTRIRRMFEITGLDRTFPVFSDVRSARCFATAARYLVPMPGGSPLKSPAFSLN